MCHHHKCRILSSLRSAVVAPPPAADSASHASAIDLVSNLYASHLACIADWQAVVIRENGGPENLLYETDFATCVATRASYSCCLRVRGAGGHDRAWTVMMTGPSLPMAKCL